MIFKFKTNESLTPLVSYILDKWQTNHSFLYLNGEMGSGKTTLVKALGQALGIKDNIISPTFNIMKVYDYLVHIDAYKIKGDLVAYEDYFDDKLVAIEWSDNLQLNYSNYIYIWCYIDEDQNHVFEVR